MKAMPASRVAIVVHNVTNRMAWRGRELLQLQSNIPVASGPQTRPFFYLDHLRILQRGTQCGTSLPDTFAIHRIDSCKLSAALERAATYDDTGCRPRQDIRSM